MVFAACAGGGVYAYNLYNSAKVVKGHAQDAMASLKDCMKAVKATDANAFDQSVHKVSDDAHAMQQELSKTSWVVASNIPFVGSDVRSVRTISDVMVDLADNGLVPLSQSSDVLNLSTLMQDSTVNIDALRSLSDVIREAHPVITRSADTVESLPPARIKQIGDVLEPAREALTSASGALNHVLPMLEYLPDMLGADGQKKTYLVLGNNIAEIHAIGGFVGMVGTITAEDGHLSLEEFIKTNVVLDQNGGARVGATEEEIDLFGPRCDTNHGDINIIPDFSRVGELYYNIWDMYEHGTVDGVLSFDSVFLQDMLGLVGSIDTSFGETVDSTNATRMTLNESLFMWEPDDCDDFYKEIANKTFERVLDKLGSIDTLEFLNIIVKNADEGRCIAWLADPAAEEAVKVAGFGLSLGHDPKKPTTGFYISDNMASKAGYYLSIDSSVGEPTVNPDGSKSYPVTVALTHNADPDLAKGEVPSYLSSGLQNQYEVSRLSLREETTILAPEGGRIENLTSEYQNLSRPDYGINWAEKSYQGLDAWHTELIIDAGESIIFNYTVVTSPEANEPLRVVHSPVVPHEVREDESRL
ncbi:MAG: DUF4012 domain-containing protein [Atopobiaceae bacterium]|nr:DUF4012 domain-containing protein [Atopobiaceae bacterium]